jgi:hypothetical protein
LAAGERVDSPDTETRVITDPGGRRVGSLGATLNVLAQVPAGGASRPLPAGASSSAIRAATAGATPAYAAQGKVFTPVPATGPAGQPLALFDLILRTVSALPAPAGGHVLITSGDVLLTFDHASVDFSRLGVTGVAYFGPVERGSRHGVYVPSGFGANPQRTECVPVVDFSAKTLRERKRARAGRSILRPRGAVDTGSSA